MFNPLLASLVLAMSASGAVAVSGDSSWTWSVVNWGAGCARRGCFYDFNITVPANGATPAVSAYCSGDEDRTNQTYFKPCGVNDNGLGNRGVSAKFVPPDDPNYGTINQIAVAFAYTDISSGSPGAVHNFTGYANITFNQFVAPPANFTITGIKEN